MNLKASSSEDFLKREFSPKEPIAEGLISKRDLVTLAARRRHGKTTLSTNLCVAVALPLDDFLGYEIPKPRKSLMLMLEDDAGEFQEKFRRVVGGRDTHGRIHLLTRDDFLEARVPLSIMKKNFKDVVITAIDDHEPDLIIVDNLAHIIGARYNDPEIIHKLMDEVYQWAKRTNAAVIIAAHPRKDDFKHPVDLQKDPDQFFEAVMGSSHTTNSTGSLWGLQRKDKLGYSIFLGGQQRGNGQHAYTLIEKGDDEWFSISPDTSRAASLALNTKVRLNAWNLLAPHPQTFGYREGEEMVKPAMRSNSSFHSWFTELKRHKLVIPVDDKYQRVAGDFTPVDF